MPLVRDSYIVYLNPTEGDTTTEPTEHTATITHQDRLRGEQAHIRAGGSDQEYLGLTTAWVWASLMRQGEYAGPYERFRDIDIAAMERGDPVTVDPTHPETTDELP